MKVGGVYRMEGVEGSLYKISGIYGDVIGDKDLRRVKIVPHGEYRKIAPLPWQIVPIADARSFLVEVP
jgi:hypothetical protein